MAITAQYIRREGLSLNHTLRYKDSITAVYRAEFDTPMSNPWTVLQEQVAQGLVPVEGTFFDVTNAPHLFAKNYETRPVDDNLTVWDTTVTWGVADDGEDQTQQQNPNPLLRPPAFNIEYIETEYPIEEAANLVALPHGDGKGGSRSTDTVGPIVNAAGKRPDEPQVDTERNAILIVERNFASLADIVNLNETYQRTTNEDTTQGFSPETLKYMVTDSLGKRIEGQVEYYPGITRIEKKKTTKRIIDNMGYAYWDDDDAEIKDDDDIKDLHNLALDGTKDSASTVIPYRYLTRVPYAPLVS